LRPASGDGRIGGVDRLVKNGEWSTKAAHSDRPAGAVWGLAVDVIRRAAAPMLATSNAQVWESIVCTALYFLAWQGLWMVLAWERRNFGLRSLFVLLVRLALLCVVFTQPIRLILSVLADPNATYP
jgi:hypothetical protein